MKAGDGKARRPMLGAICFSSAMIAVYVTGAHAQDQMSAAQQTPSTGRPPATAHFISAASLPPTHPSAMDITYASQHQPKYPPEAIRGHHEGTVRVMALIGVDGQVTETRIDQSSGYPELDESASITVRGWKFSPAYKDGSPVASWARVPIDFALPKAAAKH